MVTDTVNNLNGIDSTSGNGDWVTVRWGTVRQGAVGQGTVHQAGTLPENDVGDGVYSVFFRVRVAVQGMGCSFG